MSLSFPSPALGAVSDSPTSPPFPPLGLRLLHGLAVLGLSLGFALVVDLLLVTFIPQTHAMFGRIFNGRVLHLEADLPAALALIVFTLTAIAGVFRRAQLRTARGAVSLTLFIAAILVANVSVVALFPSLLDGFSTLRTTSFWREHGPSLVLIGFSLFAVAYAIWLTKPRSARSVVILCLIVAAILVADLVIVAFYPPLITDLEGRTLFGELRGDPMGDIVTLTSLLIIVPALLLITFWRLRRRSWWWIGGGYLALAPVLAYLATDDPVIRRPLSMDEIAPAFPGAEASHEVLMRYGKFHPLGKNFRAPARIFDHLLPSESVDAAKPDAWHAWLLNHRAGIEADWQDLAPVRTWWTELNSFERIGDLTPMELGAEVIAFSPVRTMSQHGCAMAGLQALDGRGDEAIDTLIPILQVGRKLQPSARTLVREMMAIVIERMSLQTAAFILDHAPVSAAARGRLSAVLSASGGGAAGARRLMAIEYTFILGSALSKPLGDINERFSPWTRSVFNTVGPFVYHPRATFNLYGDFVAEAQELLASRRFAEIDPRGKIFIEQSARPRFRNFIGCMLLQYAIPNYSKIGESYWNTQDLRTALLSRVEKM